MTWKGQAGQTAVYNYLLRVTDCDGVFSHRQVPRGTQVIHRVDFLGLLLAYKSRLLLKHLDSRVTV